jgi:uncharacterized membrane protein HdeD (DUF308 family)
LLRGAADLWWVFLVTGILWLLVAIIVLRFNETSLNTVGLLVGAFVLLAGINEFVAMAFVERWRWVHGLLGVLFFAIGILALFHPAHTFWVVAWLFAFYLLFKGIFDITISIFERDVVSVWWLRLVVGILEVGLAFWASGDYYATGNFTRRAVLLVLWVGFGALFRGINEIVIAFSLHGAKKELAAS